jgi:hypothetical protein
VQNLPGVRAGWIPRDLADSTSPDILEEKMKIVGCIAESKNVVDDKISVSKQFTDEFIQRAQSFNPFME